jgi:DNA-binding CsgD family transcriptional regulator/PAS domain-containing protein
MPGKSLRPEDFSATIADIYDCALDTSRWTEMLTRLNARIDGAYAGFALSDPSATLPRMAAFSPWDPEMLRRLSTEFSPADVPALAAMMASDVDVGATQLSAMPEVAFQATAFYREWVAPQGLRDAYCVTFVRTPERFGLSTFTTRQTRAPISPQEISFGSMLSPHIRRSVMIGDMLNAEPLAARIFRTALDHLAAPVIVVDASSVILYANGAAEAMLGAGRPISRGRDGRVAPENPAIAPGLADAIARSAGDAATDLGARGIGLPLSAPGAKGAVAYVLPLGPETGSFGQGRAAAAVFIATQSSRPPPAEELVASLYDLTRAEARVLLRVGGGASTGEAAVALGVSENTVKSQLARVFAKTGTGRKAELALMLSSLSPLIGQPQDVPDEA